MPEQLPTAPPAFFIDIETVPAYENILDAPEWMMEQFKRRFKSMYDKHKDNSNLSVDYMEIWNDVWKGNAALHAEFCQIVSISIGKLFYKEAVMCLKIKNVMHYDEKELLKQFCVFIKDVDALCAHNGKEFDFPILFRRMIIKKVKVPNIMLVIGKKPYELPFEDTMDFYSHTQWKNKVSLSLLCESFGIASPKGEITGADVATVWYNKEELPFEKERIISTYNNGDIVALALVYIQLKQLDIVINPEQIIYA